MQSLLLTSIVRRAMRRPVRSFLTILQLAVGAFAVATAFGLLTDKKSVSASPDVFEVVAGTQSTEGNRELVFDIFKAKDLKTLLKSSPDLELLDVHGYGATTDIDVGDKRYKLNTELTQRFSEI